MYQGILHAHSGLRWILLIALVAALIQAFTSNGNRKTTVIAMALMHLQVVIGLGLYFFLSPKTKHLAIDMKNTVSRFYGMEHFVMMIIAAILVTMANSAIKKGNNNRHKWLLLIGLVILLAGIPWPFRIPGAGWF